MIHEEIISKMSLEDKAKFMTGKDFWQTMDFPELNVRSMFLSDGPHGLRKQAAAADHLGLNASIPATCYPTAATMANSWNPELGEELGKHLGAEAASMDVSVVLGPGLNMKRNPLCGRNFEYFAEDPYLAGKIAAGYVRGIQSNNVASCIKHFACNNQELRRMVVDSVVDERTLREIYLTAFEIAVKEGGAEAIMSSYNRLNGEFTNENAHLLNEILREEWGFKGVVITDWAGCNDRVAGLKAGNELEMPSCKYGIEDIINAVNDGSLSEELLNERVDNLLTLMDKTANRKVEPFDVVKHNNVALKCAEESLVLLKNDNALPLTAEEKVAFIGDFAYVPRYQGAGSSVVNPTQLENVIEADKCGLNYIGAEKGFNRNGKPNAKLLKSAVELAKQADTVVFFMGLDEVSEAEGLDRPNMRIKRNQLDVLKAIKETGKKVVVVLLCGSAVEIAFEEDCDALVYACLSGQAGMRAINEVLAGKVNPSGKLSESFPLSYDDCPTANYFPGLRRNTEYREGPFIGYRYYTTADVAVRYPFGFGLSYTKFEYSGLTVDEKGVKFTVKNVGDVYGGEVAQMYVSLPNSKIIRPLIELKGFNKVFLNPGEEKTVEIAFDDKTFRYFNTVTNGWEVEGGEYKIQIGASSVDIRLEGTIKKAQTAELPYAPDAHPTYMTGKITHISEDEFAAILGRPVPDEGFEFYKKNRIHVHDNVTVNDLRYAPGWAGRLFSGAIRFVIKCCYAFGNRNLANTLVMGVLHQPVRGLAKFGGMTSRQLKGLKYIFNGKFFKGVGIFLTKGKKKDAAKAEAK